MVGIAEAAADLVRRGGAIIFRTTSEVSKIIVYGASMLARTETTMIAEPQERKVGHAVIAKFFEPKVRDMGGGLRIIELPSYITVDERDLIVKAVQAYISRSV
jgi:hypothetical protein